MPVDLIAKTDDLKALPCEALVRRVMWDVVEHCMVVDMDCYRLGAGSAGRRSRGWLALAPFGHPTPSAVVMGQGYCQDGPTIVGVELEDAGEGFDGRRLSRVTIECVDPSARVEVVCVDVVGVCSVDDLACERFLSFRDRVQLASDEEMAEVVSGALGCERLRHEGRLRD